MGARIAAPAWRRRGETLDRPEAVFLLLRHLARESK